MTLLVTGIAGTEADGTLGGAGAAAAIAAAPLMRVQLWARLGAQPAGAREAIRRRGLDLAGISWEGPPVQVAPTGSGPGPFLPEVEPTSAEDLRAVLCTPLPSAEAVRATRAISLLQPPLRLALVAPGAPPPAGTGIAIARAVDAAALTGTPAGDLLAAARALQGLGPKTVVITGGVLGGLIVHGDLVTTYPALPLPPSPAAADAPLAAVVAGALAGWCAGAGGDFAAVKRGCALGSALAGVVVQGGLRRLMAMDRAQCLERFNRLRRAHRA